MRVGLLATLGVGLGSACARDHSNVSPFAKLETEIGAALTARIGAPVTVHCPTPIACIALGPEHAQIPILLARVADAWTWRVAGLLVISDALEAYLATAVADLGAAQAVQCAPRIRVLAANERIDCWLANGGKAFVTVHADGSTGVEIDLDKGAGDARSEVRSVQKEEALARLSRALEHEENSDGEEATVVPVAGDGGPDDGGTVPRP